MHRQLDDFFNRFAFRDSPHLSSSANNSPPVFDKSSNNEVFSNHKLYISKITKDHGTRFNMHVLQYILANRLYRKGIDIKIAQGILHHADVKT